MPLRQLVPLFLFCAFLLTSCFQTRMVIFLNADGSGTIEETVMIATFAVNMLSEMDSTQTFNLVDEEKLIARQDSFGLGVTFEGVEAITEGGYQGYLAVYSFEDINQIRLAENSDALKLGADDAQDEDDPTEGLTGMGLDKVRFVFSPGLLEIEIPREGDGKETEIHPDTLAAKTEEIRAQMIEQGRMMRAFLADAQMSATIVFPGAIAETNATYVDSTTVTLADIVFGSMLDLMEEDPELSARLQLAATETERQTMLAEVGEREGFRYEPKERVMVRFE